MALVFGGICILFIFKIVNSLFLLVTWKKAFIGWEDFIFLWNTLSHSRKASAEKWIMMGAKLIAPIIETDFDEGFDWYGNFS